ncbi:protein tyrosine phosphatase family protein [Salinisphaera sp. RV14]|uniref:protein tyrosine phosphatase family protein n=1 Tax=unclassified Salinisphaera TaxID=2649847 RepID=UPI003F85D9EF
MSDYPNDLKNARRFGADIVTAGQPSRAQLVAAGQAGVKTVINLRPAGEFGEFDEARVVADAGMRYVNIPVAVADDIDDRHARDLDDALAAAGGTPALVHCASSNRVGALMAYRARHLHGESAEHALDIGLSTGLDPQSPLYEATRNKLR